MEQIAQDLDLIKLVANGSQAAMQQLYAKYYQPIKSFVRQRLVDANAQDDIVQETMLSIWRHAGDFRGESKLSSWIFTIAARIAYRFNIKSKKQNTLAKDESLRGDQSTNPDPLELLYSPTEKFMQCIESLPEKQRRALTMKYLMGLSCAEAAELEGCCESTIKTRLHYGRCTLARYITEQSETNT